jgi:hypothetical protein
MVKIDLSISEFHLVKKLIYSQCDCEGEIDTMKRSTQDIGFKCFPDSHSGECERKSREFLKLMVNISMH